MDGEMSRSLSLVASQKQLRMTHVTRFLISLYNPTTIYWHPSIYMRDALAKQHSCCWPSRNHVIRCFHAVHGEMCLVTSYMMENHATIYWRK